jgi:hypothetical protein
MNQERIRPPYRKTERMAAVEERFHMPIQDVLYEIYDRTLSVRRVAQIIGVSAPTAHHWLYCCRIPVRKLLHPTEGYEIRVLQEYLDELMHESNERRCRNCERNQHGSRTSYSSLGTAKPTTDD